MQHRVILHADMDAFFAAVEILDHPELTGRSVVVGGSSEGRGVVCSASYAARAYGVRSAMPTARAARLCPHAVFLQPRHARYMSVSREIFRIFRSFSEKIQGLSCDEAFLDMSETVHNWKNARQAALALKEAVLSQTGLIVSVGVGPNKFLAKLASDMEKPDGLVILSPEDAAETIAPLPVRRLWGVGPVAAGKLEALKLRTLADVRQASPTLVRAAVGNNAERLQKLAWGFDDRPVEASLGPKSIGCERTFSKNIHNSQELQTQLEKMTYKAAEQLRKKKLKSRRVTVKARFPDFQTITRAKTLLAGSHDPKALFQTALELFHTRLKRDGKPLRLLGVSLSELEGNQAEQLQLFKD